MEEGSGHGIHDRGFRTVCISRQAIAIYFCYHGFCYTYIIYLRSPRYVEKPRLYNIKEIDSHRLDLEWMVELWEI